MKLRTGQVVKFYKAQNDSARASECFGFDSSCGNDWFSIQYYPEQVLGVVVKTKGTILIQEFFIKADGDRYLCDLHDLSKNGINNRINIIKEMLVFYNLSECDFFEEIPEKFDVFKQIEVTA